MQKYAKISPTGSIEKYITSVYIQNENAKYLQWYN